MSEMKAFLTKKIYKFEARHGFKPTGIRLSPHSMHLLKKELSALQMVQDPNDTHKGIRFLGVPLYEDPTVGKWIKLEGAPLVFYEDESARLEAGHKAQAACDSVECYNESCLNSFKYNKGQ